MATTPPAHDSFDFAKGFRFTFDDPDWIKKLLIGGLFSLAAMLLVGLPFLAGYWMRLARNAARGEPRPLPEWDDLGGLFSEGLQTVVVYIVYFAVVLVLPVGAIITMAVLVGGLSAAGSDSDALAGLAGVLGVMGMLAFYALLFLAIIVLWVFVPAAMLRVALTGRLGAGFEVREIWAFIRRNVGNYALALVLFMVANFASQFGIILCCVGIFPAAFWAYCVLAWGVGEVARLDSGA